MYYFMLISIFIRKVELKISRFLFISLYLIVNSFGNYILNFGLVSIFVSIFGFHIFNKCDYELTFYYEVRNVILNYV